MTGHWVRVEGQCRCQNCTEMVAVTWRWFSRPARWTLAYCEQCVEIMLDRNPA